MDSSFNSSFSELSNPRKKYLKGTRMSLFQDNSVFEFSPMTMCTPDKYECMMEIDSPMEYIKPMAKKELSPLDIDEDSGIGMDVDVTKYVSDVDTTENIKGPSAALFDTPTSAFSLKRPFRAVFSESIGFQESRGKQTPKSTHGSKRTHQKLNKAITFEDEAKTLDTAIVNVLDRIADDTELVSDGSRTYRLPTVRGKVQDLKNISPQTMVDLLEGKYKTSVRSYRIIDCRYPYEFEGGHIQGADNLYTQEMITEFINSEVQHRSDILIFHCEFSSERGPKLCRFLRSKDRELNSDNYPTLYYPEVYLLCGGYKDFFNTNKTLCEPMTYKPMLHSDHGEDLRHFRSKSKSWSGREKRSTRSSRLKF